MSKIEKPKGEWEKRYQVVVTTDDEGHEHLTIQRLTELADVPKHQISDEQLIDLACRIYDTRRSRSRYFADSMFGEPVWDMLLALFCLPSRHERLSVTGLCYSADVPLTTGLRFVRQLEEEGVIERTPDWKDGRRSYLHLTPHGEKLMREYLSSIYHKLTVI